MTKEQILGNNEITEWSIYFERAKTAMDEYAKQDGIEFLKWAVKNHSVDYEGFNLSGNRLLGGDTIFVNGEELTMSQFYDLYIQTKVLVV